MLSFPQQDTCVKVRRIIMSHQSHFSLPPATSFWLSNAVSFVIRERADAGVAVIASIDSVFNVYLVPKAYGCGAGCLLTSHGREYAAFGSISNDIEKKKKS